MPADYIKKRDKYVKEGMSLSEAKKQAAIWYWYEHGKSVNDAHKELSSRGWYGQAKRHASAARKGWRNRR
jgi:hypothetical protein